MKTCFYFFQKSFIVIFAVASFFIGLIPNSRQLLILYIAISIELFFLRYHKTSQQKYTIAIAIHLKLNNQSATNESVSRRDSKRKIYLLSYIIEYPQSVVGKIPCSVDKNLFPQSYKYSFVRYLTAPISISGYTRKVTNTI